MTLLEVLEDDIVKLIERDEEHLIPTVFVVDKEMFMALLNDSHKTPFWNNCWGPGWFYLTLAGSTVRIELEPDTTVVH